MLRLISFIFVCALFNCGFSKEESCSRFEFLERLLEKMAKMELNFDQLQKNVNTAQNAMDTALKSAETKLETLEIKSEAFAEGLAAQIEKLDEQVTANFTCALTKKLSEMGILSTPTACPDGWIPFQNSCYLFGDDDVMFNDAQKFCQTFDANLVNIESPKENSFLRSQLKKRKAPRHWIGMTDMEREGEWKHYPSHSDVTFFDWGKHQPNNGRVSNCGAFWESFQYLWVDEPCTNKFKPLCEKKSDPGVSIQ
ncbi:perlucin-like protein [Mercenaria mercenaria]|uniref:perlucin-like protein n=1 Tax=Mercenaria mercenaria TaxID=6596 RepID=UPI00234E675C|nr:perlucin-like protein [Mercenaria mercenaria]